METIIEKTAKDVNRYKRKTIFYKSARQGFSEILKSLKKEYNDYILLLPAYIGYSVNEGSGIYDPVVENEIEHCFYTTDENIHVNIKDYKKKVLEPQKQVVILLVHYFGYIDPKIKEIVEIARDNNAIIIEDCAHALYTDYIDHQCGEYADVSIYSLHKMLPYKDGGMVKINNSDAIQLTDTNYYYNILDYDLRKIAEKRKKNAETIENELKDCQKIKILRKVESYQHQTPQTYPILILKADKNELYHKLNEKGFGVVSLYHTMIQDLQNDKYKTANELGTKILNLPVHQDTDEIAIKQMCGELKKLLEESE